jgi:3-hydroxyethyl bacteriochlorophyllide a dehydrogenase
MLSSLAVVLEQPERIALTRLALDPPGAKDVVVETEWSGISAGTERLLFKGRMPPFPGMGYPLVPGYESVGKVIDAGREAAHGCSCPAHAALARCAACMAAPPRIS